MFGTKTVDKPEVASFPFIEEMLDKALGKKVEPTAAQKDEAKSKSRSVVAGFPVFDPDKEKAELDKLCSAREKAIKTFIDDRAGVRAKLKALGITPLAVVPIKAWYSLCEKAELFILQPNSTGQVAVNRDAVRRYSTAKKAEAAAAANYVRYVRTLLTPEYGSARTDWRMYPTVIFPTPPQDVVDILVKAKSLALKTAAVAEAIRFAQSPTEIYEQVSVDPKDLWARQQGYADYADWIKRDPIVFHEHGTAAAIIAQFGEFPIEKKVVEIVMDSDDLIPEKVGEALISQHSLSAVSGYTLYSQTPFDQHRYAIEQLRMRYEHERMMDQQTTTQYDQPNSAAQGTGIGGLLSSPLLNQALRNRS